VALDEAECWRLLRSQTLGRIGIIIDAQPEVFPVNYTAAEGEIVFRTGLGVIWKAVRSACCFEVDSFTPSTGTGWSVLVHGPVRERRAEELGAHARRVHPAAPGVREHWMAMTVQRVSGRYFSSGPMAPPAY
jgi:nitroimidazol reductase NimA-like FMN-containing flavoprotein (pyridoxamine 5'-phosphate oxidase superfamily)